MRKVPDWNSSSRLLKETKLPAICFLNTSDDPITLAHIAEEQEASSLLSSLLRRPMSSK